MIAFVEQADVRTRLQRLGYTISKDEARQMISEVKNRYGALAHGNGRDRRHWLWSMSLYQPDFPQGGYVESTTPGWSRASTAGLSDESTAPTEMPRDLSKLFRALPALNHIRDIGEQSRSPPPPPSSSSRAV